MECVIILLVLFGVWKFLRWRALKSMEVPSEVIKAFEDFQQRFGQPLRQKYVGDRLWVLIDNDWFYFAQGKLQPGLYTRQGKKIGIWWNGFWEFKEQFYDGFESIYRV